MTVERRGSSATRAVVARSTHFGPSVFYVGGMGSVLALYAAHNIGADDVQALATWVPDSSVRSASKAARAIARILRFDRDHVVHVHVSEGGSFVREGAVACAASVRGCPVVISIHGARFPEFLIRQRWLVSSVLRRADAIVVLSAVDLAAVRAIQSIKHVELIPNPTPTDDESPSAGQTSEIVLFAGEIGLRKGADVLEQAWVGVAKARPAARCILVGPLDMDEPPCGERLEVRPPVDRGEMRELLRQARVVVLPSRQEALPMILTETMAAARPFISTPVGGVPSLSPGGLLVPVDAPGALALAIIELLADPERAEELGSRGQELCRETRSINEIDSRLCGLYTGAKAARRARRRVWPWGAHSD